MNFDFKLPSVIPQDLLLIQDLIGAFPAPIVTAKRVPSSGASIASSDDEAESEDEVEADLAPPDEEDSGISVAMSDSTSHSDSESGAACSDSEEGDDSVVPQQRLTEDEESSITTEPAFLYTKNEIVDTNIIVPSISEVERCDTLEKVGEIMSIVGDTVIVRGLAMNNAKSLSERALDAESLLVFEDRKVLGYIYETFGPTSQPLYQIKFNQHYPLDTNNVWLSREVFHVPQRSHFVFVERLKNLRGSDASNIFDEEPADDEIEFSDDEKEAAFKAQRKKRRGHSIVSSRQPAGTPSRIHTDDAVQNPYCGSNPYDAHGPYDDGYHTAGPARPSPVPYDDPYADVPTSDVRVHPMGWIDGSEGKASYDEPTVSRRRTFTQGERGSGSRNRQSWNTSGRGYRQNSTGYRRTFDSEAEQPPPGSSLTTDCITRQDHSGEVTTPQPFVQPTSNTWLFPGRNDVPSRQECFIQPHINPRFASMFGLNLPPGTIGPWASQNAYSHSSYPQHWVDAWTVHSNVGSGGEGDTYKPM